MPPVPPSKCRKNRGFDVFNSVPGCAKPCQAVGVARGGSARGIAAPGREMEVVVLLCLVAVVWSSYFWAFLVLWALAESVVVLRRWEGLLRGA